MGVNQSARKPSFDASGEVNFDHFQILRAIGKGSFGKVCIVQKKDTKKMYAMKYMNKNLIIKKDAIKNVIREVDLLKLLVHPFLVNLWFSFQDEEDMFMVVDLLLGGDLRYHMQQNVKFEENSIKLYMAEIALALDYLRQQKIIHRDIKPDNILLDENGHVHITDFNIATELQTGHLAVSISGTKPYMAPEVFACSTEDCSGYSFPVDWWSLGIMVYEMLRGRRPYEIHSNTSIKEVQQMWLNPLSYPTVWSNDMRDLLKKCLLIDPDKRLSTLEELKSHPFMSAFAFDKVLQMEIKPLFVPAKDHLNCDPTFELEEMIIEAKPLHKKKKRLAKKNSKTEKTMMVNEDDPMQVGMKNIDQNFKPYNREREGLTQEKDNCKTAVENTTSPSTKKKKVPTATLR